MRPTWEIKWVFWWYRCWLKQGFVIICGLRTLKKEGWEKLNLPLAIAEEMKNQLGINRTGDVFTEHHNVPIHHSGSWNYGSNRVSPSTSFTYSSSTASSPLNHSHVSQISNQITNSSNITSPSWNANSPFNIIPSNNNGNNNGMFYPYCDSNESHLLEHSDEPHLSQHLYHQNTHLISHVGRMNGHANSVYPIQNDVSLQFGEDHVLEEQNQNHEKFSYITSGWYPRLDDQELPLHWNED